VSLDPIPLFSVEALKTDSCCVSLIFWWERSRRWEEGAGRTPLDFSVVVADWVFFSEVSHFVLMCVCLVLTYDWKEDGGSGFVLIRDRVIRTRFKGDV